MIFFHFHSHHCLENQSACVFQGEPDTIFINRNFLQLSQPEKIAVIWHEWMHLLGPGIEHISCRNQMCPPSAYVYAECDKDSFSPYGLEYQWWKFLEKNITEKNLEFLKILEGLPMGRLIEFVDHSKKRICSKFE